MSQNLKDPLLATKAETKKFISAVVAYNGSVFCSLFIFFFLSILFIFLTLFMNTKEKLRCCVFESLIFLFQMFALVELRNTSDSKDSFMEPHRVSLWAWTLSQKFHICPPNYAFVFSFDIS